MRKASVSSVQSGFVDFKQATVVCAVCALLTVCPSMVMGQDCFIVPDGLVSWWDADAVTETTAYDIESGNHGTLANGTDFTAGVVGQAFSLDGVDDFVDDIGTPSSFSFIQNTGVFTVDAWIRLNDPNASREYAITSDTATSGEKGHFFVWRNGIYGATRQLIFTIANGAGPEIVIASASPPNVVTDTQWHHVAAVGNGTTITFYVDGNDYPGTGTMGNMSQGDSTRPLNLGRCPYVYPLCHFNGSIDEVEIFDRALNHGEILAIFEAGSAGKCKDEDGDGFRPPEDCDETDPSINPDGLELPGNSVDENCDGDLGNCYPCLDWQNHGKYVRCVAHAVNDLVDAGFITEDEGDVLVSSAAQSDIGKTGFVPPECQP